MRTTFDLLGDLLQRAKITAVKRGSSVRDLTGQAVHQLSAETSDPRRQRMTEAPISYRRDTRFRFDPTASWRSYLIKRTSRI